MLCSNFYTISMLNGKHFQLSICSWKITKWASSRDDVGDVIKNDILELGIPLFMVSPSSLVHSCAGAADILSQMTVCCLFCISDTNTIHCQLPVPNLDPFHTKPCVPSPDKRSLITLILQPAVHAHFDLVVSKQRECHDRAGVLLMHLFMGKALIALHVQRELCTLPRKFPFFVHLSFSTRCVVLSKVPGMQTMRLLTACGFGLLSQLPCPHIRI